MQNNVLTIEELKEIIDNLYRTIGVRMDLNLSKHPKISDAFEVNYASFLDDCKVITDHLELPINVLLSYSSSFKTTGMVRNEGGATSGIGAQIHIPADLPWYKTDAMKNFPIKVTIPPEAFELGHFYLMTQLSHEFSHIYLHSRRDPQKESEWATDLCALMMGFTPLWQKGRTRRTNNFIHTQGYLSYGEFDFAVSYIAKFRSPFAQLRKDISESKQKIQSDCNNINQYIEDIYLLYDFHFKHPQTYLKHIEDGVVFSKLAQSQLKSDIEQLMEECKRDTNAILKSIQTKKEYYEKDKEWLKNQVERLNAIDEKLERKLEELKHDYDVILQNIDVVHHTKVFNTRMKSLSEGVRQANMLVQATDQTIKILNNCLDYYQQYKKKSVAKEEETKTLSLIQNAAYTANTRAFIRNQQDKIDEIEGLIKKARLFYSVDDQILVSKQTELNDVISILSNSLNEQKKHIHVVRNNLNFIGKTKWILKGIFT